ncbi:MAG: tRNA1(Val) (adenine(37)-N6)-methyltransferase [Tissierellia bacterium]|nr:tRNA1(Val) (adenine(37)-N6)-methyltransferase [Tissierellia bacterium]
METILKENERIDIVPGTNLKIIQDKSRFCYGIDAILLSDFATCKRGSNIMDLGTGTGIIPLRLYSLYNPEKIYGVEIQEEVAKMASRSVSLNKLQYRIEIINMDLRELPSIFDKGTFDVVTSNPPYIKKGAGLINPNEALALSRHEIKCSLDDIIRVSNYLLKDRGRLYLVHRPNRLVDIIWTTRQYKLEPKTIRLVQPKVDASPNLVLLECVKGGNVELKFERPLVVYNRDGSYTEEIYEIYGMKENLYG